MKTLNVNDLIADYRVNDSKISIVNNKVVLTIFINEFESYSEDMYLVIQDFNYKYEENENGLYNLIIDLK